MKKRFLKNCSMRIISAMLLFAMLIGSFASFSIPADAASEKITIDQGEFTTTLTLLTEVVQKNLSTYNIKKPSEEEVKAAFMEEAEELHYTEFLDEANNISYPDRITEVPVYNVIENVFNDKIAKSTTGTTGTTSGSGTEVTVTLDPTALINYSGSVLRTNYTYGDLIMDYIKAKEPGTASIYDSKLTELITAKVTTKSINVSFKQIIKSVKDYIEAHADDYKSYEDADYLASFTNEHCRTFYEYTRTNTVPMSTLFIGTYLIDASAINDVYYRYALDSMGTLNQNIMYYKSELDAGHWKDIISAGGLSDIMPTSSTVQDADLMAYKITCVIGADGIPRYPDTGAQCDIFTMTEPYDMAAIPELVRIKIMLDSGVVTQDTNDPSNRYVADVLYRFFNYDGVGDNQSMMIIRNKGYRDYVFDHVEEGKDIVGKNPVPMKTKVPSVNITEDEIRYVTGLKDKQLHLSCNMAQTQDRYPGHQEAFMDQILSWAEYYGNNKFGRNARPTLFPLENFIDSAWERLDWRASKNPQSYMFIINGSVGTSDQKEFMDRWMSDSYIDYNTYSNWYIQQEMKDPWTYVDTGVETTDYWTAQNWKSGAVFGGPSYTYREERRKDPVYYINYENLKAATSSGALNDAFFAYTGLNELNAPTGTTFHFGQKWKDFQNLMYRYMDWMRNMYDIRDNVTRTSDEQLKILNELYLSERKAGRINESDTLMRLMSRVDATRRAEIYYNLTINENNNVVVGPTLMLLMDILMDGKSPMGQNYEFITGDTEAYAANDAVISALEDCLVNCQNKYSEYSQLALNPTQTHMKMREYNITMRILDTAATSSQRSQLLHDLNILYNIDEGAIVNREEECTMLNTIMNEDASPAYAEAIHDVAGEDYHTMAADPNASKGALREVLELQKDEANGEAAQLQLFIKAYCLRRNTSQGILFVNRRLDWAQQQKSAVRTDDPFGAFAMASLNEHIKWLSDVLKQVKNGTLGAEKYADDDFGIGYAADLLDNLDNNNYDAVEKMDEEADRNGDTSGTAGKKGIGDGSTDGDGDTNLDGFDNPYGEPIRKLEEKLDEYDGNPRMQIPIIEQLGYLGDANLKNLYEEYKLREAPDNVLKAFEKAIGYSSEPGLNPFGLVNPYDTGSGGLNNGDGSGGNGNGDVNSGRDDGSGNGDGDGDGGNGDGEAPRLTDDDIRRIIEDVLGKTFDGLDDEDKAIVVAACTRFGIDYTYDEVSTFGRGVMYEALDENNPFFYHQFTGDTSREYVNLAAVDKPRKSTGLRYVKQGRKVTMTQINRSSMSASYEFTVGTKDLRNRAGKVFKMDANTAQQLDPYVRGSLARYYAYITTGDATRYLGITSQYVNRSEYAVFLTSSMELKKQDIYEAIETEVEKLEASVEVVRTEVTE